MIKYIITSESFYQYTMNDKRLRKFVSLQKILSIHIIITLHKDDIIATPMDACMVEFSYMYFI